MQSHRYRLSRLLEVRRRSCAEVYAALPGSEPRAPSLAAFSSTRRSVVPERPCTVWFGAGKVSDGR